MKKVGMCVCYDTKNYGSQLQVLATQIKVKDFGYDYEIIRYKKKYDIKMILKTLLRFFNRILLHDKFMEFNKNQKIKKYPEINTKNDDRKKIFGKFIEEYFDKLSPIYYGYDALKKGVKNYDGFLVGSDQLWCPSGLASGFYTLGFVPDNYTKIAYATSFGVSKIPSYQIKRTRDFLNRFDYLSSRELRGTQIIRELTGKDVPAVLDPTLLLTCEGWHNVIPKRRVVDEKYIFCYYLGTNAEHREAARLLSKKTGLPIVTLPFLDNFVKVDVNFGDMQLFDISSADFVNLIRGAEYVLTDSFHGSVFSIINQKKFLTFNRFAEGAGSRNSRIDSLCNQLGLQDRRYNGNVEIVKNEIDYSVVTEKLTDLRKKSLDYLENALNNI